LQRIIPVVKRREFGFKASAHVRVILKDENPGFRTFPLRDCAGEYAGPCAKLGDGPQLIPLNRSHHGVDQKVGAGNYATHCTRRTEELPEELRTLSHGHSTMYATPIIKSSPFATESTAPTLRQAEILVKIF
jgi:hypothetical protein